eukprot:s483_g8.t1
MVVSVGLAEPQTLCRDADAQRRAKLAPSQLWLKAPSRMALEGEYTKVPERMERGQVVWKQHCGPGWIYSTSGGRWFITDREDGISACTGVLASVAPHQNRFPQEFRVACGTCGTGLALVTALVAAGPTEQWQEFTSGVWQVAPSVAVVVDEECLKLRHLSSLSMDNEFQVLPPKFPQNLWVMSSELTELEAEYLLQDWAYLWELLPAVSNFP